MTNNKYSSSFALPTFQGRANTVRVDAVKEQQLEANFSAANCR